MANLFVLSEGAGSDYDTRLPVALVIADQEGQAQAAADTLQRVGCEPRRAVRFEEAAHSLSSYDGLDMIVIETAGAPDDLLDIVLARADTLARERALAIVVTAEPDQLDAAVAQLLGPRTQILCDPSEAERISALVAAKWLAGTQLNDVTRDAESVRLQRLNEEVARIADTLARLTRGEEDAPRGVRDDGAGYRGPDDAIDVSATEVRSAIRARRMRAQFFSSDLFADPAWDMLLDLFASNLERRRVSVSSLCIAAAVPPTTALRWIGTLHDAGLFERQADPSDRRRAYIGLSEKGLTGMRGYASSVKRAGLYLV